MQYYRASIASDASTYEASPELQHALDKLKDEFLAAEQVVDSFNAGNQSTTPALEGLRLPLVIESADADQFKIGDCLYGVPRHICPTVALYSSAIVIEKHQIVGSWKVAARERKLTI